VASLFFSYSHKDEDLRDQLEVHLSTLKRQGLLSSWHDRRILAGAEFGNAIDENLDSSDIILLLISPDFIASEYCYEKEMKRALARHAKREARVIPVILRPCDWTGLPFGSLLAAPKDGLAITKWPNIDDAFLDVVLAIKKGLTEVVPHSKGRQPQLAAVGGPVQDTVRSSNLRIKKQFTELDKDRFRRDGFEYIARYFENSLKELVSRHAGLEESFRKIDANHFSAAAYQEGKKVCKGSVSMGSSSMLSNSIEYSMTDEPRHGSMNEAVSVKADDQMLYFEPMGMQFVRSR